MNKIVYMKFGSHLYGTDTEKSDADYKGIYIPSKTEIYLSKFPKTINKTTGGKNQKNTKIDVDEEIFSIHQFVKLACEGQTIALDMLHAPNNMILEKSYLWDELVKNRSKFYTKRLTTFIGYCRRQASKYGIKGSRLQEARNVIECLVKYPEDTKMKTIWKYLPQGDHIHCLEPQILDTNKYRMYQVCGKKFQETVSTNYVVSVLTKFAKQYGARAELAAKNEGIDWKAISHALRVAYQLEQLYIEGTITFPLKQADFLKKVKLGEFDYTTVVAPKLEELMIDVEQLSSKSHFPKQVDCEFWDDFIIRSVGEQI